MDNKKDLVEMGFCTKPHGIKGGLTFKLLNVEESVLRKGFDIYLFPKSEESSVEKNGEIRRISSIAFGNKVICYFEKVTERNEVEAMIPFDIFVPRNAFPELSDEEFYIVDLIGSDVFDDNTSELIGRIEGHYENGEQTIFKIKGPSQNWEIPYVDAFFKEVNITEKSVRVILPVMVSDR